MFFNCVNRKYQINSKIIVFVSLMAILLSLFIFGRQSSMGPGSSRAQGEEDFKNLQLWYDKPATEWTQGLPVGNGRLGAMVFGGIRKERIQLNEESVWAGPPFPEAKEGMYEAMERTRELLFEGQYSEAEKNSPREFASAYLAA